MNKKTVIQLGIGTVAFIVWSLFAYYDPTARGAYLTFVISVVTTLSALVLRDMPTQESQK